MPTTAPSAPASPTDMTGQVLTEAARRMLPVLAAKVMTALADQAVTRIDLLAERLDDYRDNGPAPRDRDDDTGEDGDAAPSTMAGTALAFLVEQVRAALAVVVRLVAQAAEMLRRATERLRARRAPEGIEAEAEELDDEDGAVDDIELADSEYEFADEDEDEDDRVPA